MSDVTLQVERLHTTVEKLRAEQVTTNRLLREILEVLGHKHPVYLPGSPPLDVTSRFATTWSDVSTELEGDDG